LLKNRSAMRIVDISFGYDARLQTAEQQMEQHYTSVGWAEALYRKGAEIIAIKRFSKNESFQKNGVQYHFINDRFSPELRFWQMPLKVLRKAASFQPDIVHLHNLSLPLQTLLLRILLKDKAAIILQHHGGAHPAGLKKSIADRFNAVANGYFFTTTEQGRQWFRNKKFYRKIMSVMEGSTFFDFGRRIEMRNAHYTGRTEARLATGLRGDPVFLWVGRLDNNKDPLTVLSGMEVLFSGNPRATLYMIYHEEQLLKQVKEKIENSLLLKNRVDLLGKINHDKIEAYFNSADYFVLGSHYEGSGYALSEALRCGCTPIITDIPSFRMMTNEGQLGALWQTGDPDSFVKAAQMAINKPVRKEAEACIKFFRENLCFDAIARVAMRHYQKVLSSGSNNTRI
jgi:glycosyltransferase involved in cell wall biosynthesis